MSVTQNDPGTIFLGGDRTQVGDFAAKAAITPGHLIERVNTAGVWQWQKHATAAAAANTVATNQSMMNLGVNDDYAAGDLVEASIVHKGSSWWMFIASGQNIAYGDGLESAGNGTLRILNAGVRLFTALETKANVTVQTRIRVEAE
jgi:hypothetical protein